MKPVEGITIEQSVVSTEHEAYLLSLISEEGKKAIHKVFVESLAAEMSKHALDNVDSDTAVAMLVAGSDTVADLFAQAAGLMYAEELSKYFDADKKAELIDEVNALLGAEAV